MNISSCEKERCAASIPQEMCPVRHGDDLDLTLKFVQDEDDSLIDVRNIRFELAFEHELNMDVPDMIMSGTIPDNVDASNGEVNIRIPGEDTEALRAFPKYFVHMRITDLTGYTATLSTLVMETY